MVGVLRVSYYVVKVSRADSKRSKHSSTFAIRILILELHSIDPELLGSRFILCDDTRIILVPRYPAKKKKHSISIREILVYSSQGSSLLYLTFPTRPIFNFFNMSTLDQSFVKNSVWKPDLFKGKVAFVTGGAGTICRVQVEALVLLGANAAIIGRNPEKTEKAAAEIQALRPGAKVIGIGKVDVREVEQLAAAAKKTVDELGKIDFVIAGAAGNFLSDFNHLSANAFKSVVLIDLLGSYNTIKATFSELKKNKGVILFVSATLHYYGVPFQSHVGAAKAGIDALSNALAVELGPLGIRSNCIAPGAIAGTEGFDRLVQSGSEEGQNKVPLARWGTTKDIAEATVYLFSPAASYVTGTIQVVDGGFWHLGSFAGDFYPSVIKQQNSIDNPKL